MFFTVTFFSFACYYIYRLYKLILNRIYHIEYKGETYEFNSKTSYKELLKWFEDYALKAPKCPTCNRLILPGDAVGIDIRNKYVHMNIFCEGSASFVGHISDDGKLKPYFKK